MSNMVEVTLPSLRPPTQVDALRGKVSQLEGELRTSGSTIGQLHNQLAEDRRGAEEEARRLQEKNKNLAMQVSARTRAVDFSCICCVP